MICSEMGIKRGIERERETNKKKWAERERERARMYVKAVEKNNKKLRRKNILLKYLVK